MVLVNRLDAFLLAANELRGRAGPPHGSRRGEDQPATPNKKPRANARLVSGGACGHFSIKNIHVPVHLAKGWSKNTFIVRF